MINFRKKRIDSTKIPILKSSENPTKMHEFMHENMKINAKGRVERSYRPWERKTLQKDWPKMTKNLNGALPSRRERGKFEKVV